MAEPGYPDTIDTPAEPEVVRREVDAFAYWPHYASSIPGFGGTERPHEPRYCFCTLYITPKPGRACFIVKMSGVEVTTGEIALRIHAMRPGDPPEIALTATGYIRLDEIKGNEIEYRVAFAAVEGLDYALFSYMNEPSDIRADSITVEIEEQVAAEAIRANLGVEPISRFAKSEYATSHRLISAVRPSTRWTLSQACSLDPDDVAAWQAAFPDVAALESDPVRQWETITTRSAIDYLGVGRKGARGLFIDATAPVLEEALHAQSVDLEMLSFTGRQEASEEIWSEREGTFDFVVSGAMKNAEPTVEARQRVIGDGLRCLRGRGVGLFLMPFWTGGAHEPKPDSAAACLDRNAVQQIALRLIGQSYSVSQLAFPAGGSGGEITSFLLIAHKLA